ncbi:MAG: tetraacyldisaccharide 4'-kinase [Candidatus Omnitrophica bacterium]|nr:tetraacyldisaccharide 4'-kinase [Candidatus Omnitrophota bacterium]
MVVRLLFIIYDAIFFVALLFYLPWYFLRKKITVKALLCKFGRLSLLTEESIWVQAVSVGEVNLVSDLIKRLKEKYSYRIVISTTTLTGQKLAEEKYGKDACVIFFPFDMTVILNRFIKKINPKIFIAVETEIWPNLFFCLNRRDVPVVIVNGRISDKAYPRYKKIKSFLPYIFSLITAVGTQTKEYKTRFLSLGCPLNKLSVCGNMKFKYLNLNSLRLRQYLNKFKGKDSDKFIFLAASTHNPEESKIIEIYKQLKEKFSRIQLFIAPRHVNRAETIEKEIKKSGLKVTRLSRYQTGGFDVCLIDTIGDLAYFYYLCDACFVGGSLIDHGGQNILEPLSFNKPTCFGPYMKNFSDIARIVLDNQAAHRVEDYSEIADFVSKVYTDKTFTGRLVLNSGKVFKDGVKSLEAVTDLIDRTNFYKNNNSNYKPDRWLRIKNGYLDLLAEKEKTFFQKIVWFVLFCLSFLFKLIVGIRNQLYDRKLLKVYQPRQKVISLGNISWAGSGKTTLAAYLYHRLSENSKVKVTVLRRGYGEDEGLLLKDEAVSVVSSKSRKAALKKQISSDSLVILDDGFQHRSVGRDLDIVLLSAADIKRRHYFIPAGMFRETYPALLRADVLLITYKSELDDPLSAKNFFQEKFPGLKVYFADYQPKGFVDFFGKDVSLSFLMSRPLAACTAIGYPQGFFNKLAFLGIKPKREIVYPDHHSFKPDEFNSFADELLAQGIGVIIVTKKDKFHFPQNNGKINIYVMEIELSIEEEDQFIEDIKTRLDKPK